MKKKDLRSFFPYVSVHVDVNPEAMAVAPCSGKLGKVIYKIVNFSRATTKDIVRLPSLTYAVESGHFATGIPYSFGDEASSVASMVRKLFDETSFGSMDDHTTNLFNNLLENIENGKLPLEAASDHMFFWSPNTVLKFLLLVNTDMSETGVTYLKFNMGSSGAEIFSDTATPDWCCYLGAELTKYVEDNIAGATKSQLPVAGGSKKSSSSAPKPSGSSKSPASLRSRPPTFVKYDTKDLSDLIRLMRNLKIHFHSPEVTELLRREVPRDPAEFIGYFTNRFPSLFTKMFVEATKRDGRRMVIKHTCIDGNKLVGTALKDNKFYVKTA